MRRIEEWSPERSIVVGQVNSRRVRFVQGAQAVDRLETLRRRHVHRCADVRAAALLQNGGEAVRVAAQWLEQWADVRRRRVLRTRHVERRVARRVAHVEQPLIRVEPDGREEHSDHRGSGARGQMQDSVASDVRSPEHLDGRRTARTRAELLVLRDAQNGVHAARPAMQYGDV